MAYSVTGISKVETWTATDYDADDLALDIDVTNCMTNGTLSEDCDEWKEGTLNVRVEIDLGVPPSAVTMLKVRFYFNAMMTSGRNALLPYIDANSVSYTNEVVKDYTGIEVGTWVEHLPDAAFRAQLGDLGDKFAVRLASGESGVSGGAKTKLGEVEIDITYTTYPLAGITKDKDGVALGSCETNLFKVLTGSPPDYAFGEKQISNAVTGAYSFQVASGKKHFVFAIKDDSPHVFDATDNELVGDEG